MNQKYKQELLNVLVSIKDTELMNEFMKDILTPAEYSHIVTRWQIIKRLAKGEPQRSISKNLDVSIAKITRGSKVLQDKKGGFSQVLKLKKNL